MPSQTDLMLAGWLVLGDGVWDVLCAEESGEDSMRSDGALNDASDAACDAPNQSASGTVSDI